MEFERSFTLIGLILALVSANENEVSKLFNSDILQEQHYKIIRDVLNNPFATSFKFTLPVTNCSDTEFIAFNLYKVEESRGGRFELMERLRDNLPMIVIFNYTNNHHLVDNIITNNRKESIFIVSAGLTYMVSETNHLFLLTTYDAYYKVTTWFSIMYWTKILLTCFIAIIIFKCFRFT